MILDYVHTITNKYIQCNILGPVYTIPDSYRRVFNSMPVRPCVYVTTEQFSIVSESFVFNFIVSRCSKRKEMWLQNEMYRIALFLHHAKSMPE